ncbi:MAG: D-glycero-alpha-D-manno-heptose-1,7-bisphosphate 7-phosphatase [Candidatus Muiribacteriota bacterium]
MSKYIFFDRDGTMIKEKKYLCNPAGVEILPGVIEGLKKLHSLNYEFIIITNQSGIARGYFTQREAESVNNKLISILENNCIKINKVYICPHHPEFSGSCSCRKPEPGMIFQAAEEFDISFEKSWVVGDKCSDVLCGKKADLNTAMVKTGYGKHQINKCKPDLYIENILEFADRIINF